jgi:hypothetical protein
MKLRLLPSSLSVLELATFCAISACGSSDHSVSTLEAAAAIPSGADCPAGGTAVSVGLDVNGNGVLDPGEVAHVTNVCNLEVPSTLTRIDVEPAGAHCVTGGHGVKTGPDRNRNGALDDDEITFTTYACDPSDLFIGDFTAEMWSDPIKVAALAQAHVVTGTLTLAGDAPASLPGLVMVDGLTIAPGTPPASIDLPALTQVSGSVIAIASELDVLALPALTTIGGSLQIDNAPELARLSLLALAAVGQDAVVRDTPLLVTAELPTLGKVGGAVVLADALELVDVELPALTTVSSVDVAGTGATRVGLPALVALDSIAIQDNAALGELALPRLASASQVSILRDPALHQLDLGSLAASYGAAGALDSIHVESTALEAIDVPIETAAGRIVIANNPALAALRLASLTSASGLIIRHCPALATLEAPHLFVVDDLTLSGPLTSLSLPSSVLVNHQVSYIATGLAHLPRVRLDWRASLSVSSNPALVDLRGLDLPAELGQVSISSNALLTSLTGLESVAQLQMLQVTGNPALVDLTGLSSLIQADVIELRFNALVDLRGLDHLSSLTNYLSIMDQPALTSLDGLGALENIGGALLVRGNPVLASLDGLAALQSVGLAYGTVGGGPSFFIVEDAALDPDAIAALLARIRHN